MKYIEKEYQKLIETMKETYEDIIRIQAAFINQYEKGQLEKEIEKYNELESSESCPGCDARISELVEQVEALKKENKSLRMSNGHLKSTKVKKTKTYKKNVVCLCKDCKKYFQACRKDARRCADCKRKHAAELTKIYRAKQ